MTKPRLFARFVGAALLAVSLSIGALSLATAPTIERLAGAWIGPDEQIAYYRLEIDRAGRGLLVIQGSPDGDLSFYEITGTRVSDYQVTFDLLPLEGSDPTVTLSGEYSRGELHLVRRGVNHGYKWHHNVMLDREDEVMPRIKAVQEASARFRAER